LHILTRIMNKKIIPPPGRQVLIALIDNKMTQAQLANALSVNLNSLGMAIRGYRTGKRYQKILEQAENFFANNPDQQCFNHDQTRQ